MTPTLRILHLSDLHASVDHDWDQRRIVEALLRDLRQRHAERRFDLLVFTGDLAFAGNAADLALGKRQLLDPVMESIGLGPEGVVLVPGNHDIDRTRVDPVYEEGLKQLLDDREAVNRFLEEPERVGAATARMAAWREFSDRFYTNIHREALDPLAWTWQLMLNGLGIGVAALNSAWRSTGAGDIERGRLLVGERQVCRALENLRDSNIRVVVAHHPLDWLHPFDADDTRRELERSGAIVLTGHEHMPDPSMSVTPRGSAIYGRAGCLYEGRQYSNSYAVIDIDLPGELVVFRVRAWIPGRQDFDAAVGLAENGTITLPLPRRQGEAMLPFVPYTEVTRGLVDVVQRSSVVADVFPTHEYTSVTELLVAPRLFPVPFLEASVAKTTDQAAKVKRLDPLGVLSEHRIVIVNGDHESGVTSALAWFLERQYATDNARFPLYTLFSTRPGLKVVDADLREAARRTGLQMPADAALPDAVVAMDDVVTEPSRGLERLARHIKEHPNNIYVLGCHGSQHQRVNDALVASGLEVYRVFLGPFGRRELKQVVSKVTGMPGGDLPDKILAVLAEKRLPRNPFLMAALAAVMGDKPEMAWLNATAILDSYVNLLLGRLELPGLRFMDYRDREHLLEHLAGILTRTARAQIDRLTAEQFVVDYFREREKRGASAGRVIDDLIKRRVLMEDELGVGFRHPALQHLFAAKLMKDDRVFSAEMQASPLEHSEVLHHAAALSRSDRDLLASVGGSVWPIIQSANADATESRLDSLLDHGQDGAPPDLEHLGQSLKQTAPITPADLDAMLDDVYERLATDGGAERRNLADADAADRLGAAVELLSAVLVSSELVDDVRLRADLLKRAIQGWSFAAVVYLKREEEHPVVREVLERVLFQEPLDEKQRSMLERMIRLIVMLSATLSVISSLGSRQMQGILLNVLDDSDFMASAIHAFFCTLLACVIRLPGWPSRLVELHRQHGKHPFVADLVHHISMMSYQSPRTSDSDAAQLKAFLIDVISTRTEDRKGGVQARQALRSKVDAELLRSRTRARLRGLPADLLSEDPDDDDSERVDAHRQNQEPGG